MTDYPIYAAGKFIKTSQKLDVVNPYSGDVFATTYLANSADLENAIIAALEVQESLKSLSSFSKYGILREISDTIIKDRQRLAEVLCRESAKPIRYALGEIDRAAQTFLIAAEECKRLPKEYISLDWTKSGEKKEGLVKYFPIGLVAGIAPFNFPLNLAVHKIAPAIAAGCPIILKPASSTPLSTLELARIIDSTTLPKGAVSILPMDRRTGNQLVTDERFKLLSFTGSPVVGWEMKKNAGRKKVVLELGGNAAVIISKSANIDEAVKRSLIGGFAYSGQVCIHAQRFFVDESVFPEFVKKFTEGAKQLKEGNPVEKETEIAGMIDQENADRVEKWVNESVKQGAEILLGGKKKGIYFEPTILTKTSAKMKVVAEEVFGPVVIIEKFKAFNQAVAMVNESKFGLQAGVFTNDLQETDYAFNNIEAGGIIINDTPIFRVDHMPYGGVKESGQGREGVKYAIMDMMEARILVK
jgi:acyl-CoA reductase-like NAD-dependent aldehyde dehydrogenase